MTGEAARVYMLRWDSKFAAKVKKLRIQLLLLTRYVDDIVCVLNRINPGWSYCKKQNKVKFSKELQRTDTRGMELRSCGRYCQFN